MVDGRRQTAADAYLTPAARSPNLSIVGHAPVQRLLIKGAACLGVRYTLGGQTDTAFAEREVILTAGTIGTPHLLLLSGVGSGQHLRSVGIDTLAELPGVGENLHDHPESQVAYTAVRPVRARPDARKPVVLTRADASATPICRSSRGLPDHRSIRARRRRLLGDLLGDDTCQPRIGATRQRRSAPRTGHRSDALADERDLSGCSRPPTSTRDRRGGGAEARS